MDKSGKSRTIFENKLKAFITTLCQQLSHFQDNDDVPQTIKIVDLACGDCPLFQTILTKFHDQRNRNNKTQYFGVDKNRIILHYGAVDSLRPSLCLDVVGHNRRRGTLQAVALEGDLWTPDPRLIGADVLIFFGSFVQVFLQRDEFKSTSCESEDASNVNICSELAEILFSQWKPKIMFMDQDEMDKLKSNDRKMWSEQFGMWCCKSALKYNYERKNVYYTDGEGRTKYLTAFMQSKSAETLTSSVAPNYSTYNVIYQVDYPGCDDLLIDRPDAFLISQLKQLSIQQNVKGRKSDEGGVKKKNPSEESTDIAAIKQRKVRTTWEVVDELIAPFKDHDQNEGDAACHDLLRKLIERDDPLVNLLALERDLTIPFIRIFFDTLQMIRKYHILYLHHPRNQSRDDKPDIELRQVAERRLLQRLEQVWKDKGRVELERYAEKHYPHLLDSNGKLQMPIIGGGGLAVAEGENDQENKENQAPLQQVNENNENAAADGKEESNKIIESEELEMNLDLLERRQRSLDVVKEGEHYIHYLCALPKTQRDVTEPKTPNKFIKMSRRNWDARVRTWRIRVHDWCRDKSSLNLAGGDVPK